MADEPTAQRPPTEGNVPWRERRLRPEDIPLLQEIHDRNHPNDSWRYFLTEDGQLGLRNERTGEVMGGIDQPWRRVAGDASAGKETPGQAADGAATY